MRRTYIWVLVILCAVVLISLTLVGDGRVCGQNGVVAVSATHDSYYFRLELGAKELASYDQCFGVGSSNHIEEETWHSDDGVPIVQKNPGALEWHNITLKRVAPSDAEVWSWRKAMEDGRLDEAIQDGAITMFKLGSSEPVARWHFINGWPSRLTIEGSTEELTIVHDGLNRVEPRGPQDAGR
jgi:phage tail-like protein